MVERPRIIFWIAIVSIGLTLAIKGLISQLGDPISSYLAPPGAMAIFAVVFGAYNYSAWRWEVFGRRLSPYPIPNLNGYWRGAIDIRPSQPGKKRAKLGHGSAHESISCTINIRQTWTRISIEFDTDFTHSSSLMATLNAKEGSHGGLRYEYDVMPKAGTLPPDGVDLHRHFGVARLRPTDRHWSELSGEFYNDRSYPRWGIYELVKIARPAR
jgi:hypothetical protein